MKLHSLIKLVVFSSVISGILFSCVPARKFEDVKAANEACERERANLNKQNESLTTANNELKATISRYERELAGLVADTAMKSNTNRILTMQYDKISELYKQLLENQLGLKYQACNINCKNNTFKLKNRPSSLDCIGTQLLSTSRYRQDSRSSRKEQKNRNNTYSET